MKKKIPLLVLQKIQPIIEQNKELIKPGFDTDALFHLVDSDKNSDFYFKIYPSKTEGKLDVFWKPAHSNSVNEVTGEIENSKIEGVFNKWISIIKDYSVIHSIYDDPLLASYQKEFESEFKIIDEDANYAPFNLEQQIFLEEYLGKVEEKLLKYRNDENSTEVEDLLLDVKELKEEQTKLNKNEVVNRLSRLWAKARKVGINLLKEIFIESRKELIKHLISTLLE